MPRRRRGGDRGQEGEDERNGKPFHGRLLNAADRSATVPWARREDAIAAQRKDARSLRIHETGASPSGEVCQGSVDALILGPMGKIDEVLAEMRRERERL